MDWLRRLVRRHFWRQDSLIFEATFRCNLNCRHCYLPRKAEAADHGGELPTRRALKLIDKACGDSRCTHFTFSGGEPCLRGDLEELVRRAKRRCRHVAVITNGTLLDGGRAAELARAGAGLFELPLLSAEPRCHDALAGAEGCFDKVVRAAVEVRKTGATLVFVFVATRENIGELPGALELGTALGADAFLFNRYNAGGAGAADPGALLPTLDQLREALAVADAFAGAHGIGISVATVVQPCLIDTDRYRHLQFGYCAAGTSRAYYTIGPLGEVRPCNHSRLYLGNILHTSLAAMARGEPMRGFMAAKPGLCQPCRLAERCQGGCKAAAEQCYGDPAVPEPLLALNADSVKPL